MLIRIYYNNQSNNIIKIHIEKYSNNNIYIYNTECKIDDREKCELPALEME